MYVTRHGRSLLPRLGQLAAVGHIDLLRGLATLRTVGLDLFDDLQPFDDGTKDHMLVVQPAGFHRGQEELTAVSVWSSIRH